jgi:predicted metalloprotease with PDZ domain
MKADDADQTKAYIGADLAEENGRLTIRTVAANTPAYEQGLNTGDQIVAIDGYRASNAFLQSYLAERKPNDTVKLTVFRFDKLRDLNFKLGANMRANYSFAPVAQPSEDQKRLYSDYMKAELGR